MEQRKNTTSPSHNTGLNSRTFSVKGNCRLLEPHVCIWLEVSVVSEQLQSHFSEPWTRPSHELSYWEQRFSSASLLLGIKRLHKAFSCDCDANLMRQSRPRPRLHDNFAPASPHSVRHNGHVCRQGNNTTKSFKMLSGYVCNGTGLFKIWLIAFTDNSKVLWVLLAVWIVGSNLDSSETTSDQSSRALVPFS